MNQFVQNKSKKKFTFIYTSSPKECMTKQIFKAISNNFLKTRLVLELEMSMTNCR